MPNKLNRDYFWQILPRYSSIAVRLLLFIAIFIAFFPWLYEIKSRAGIDLVPNKHAGYVLEKRTRGIVKCEWLYPYRCERKIF